MIDLNYIFNEIGNQIGLLCDDKDDTDLMSASEFAVLRGLSAISVVPKSVPIIWPWLETSNTKILARFDFCTEKTNISEFSASINTDFKQGANGIQVFLKASDLGGLVSQIVYIKDDLFFNKELSVALNVSQIDAYDWPEVFSTLKKLNATSLAIYCDNPDEFVGKLYAVLSTWDCQFGGALDVLAYQNLQYIDNAYRLIKCTKPELLKTVRFFVNY